MIAADGAMPADAYIGLALMAIALVTMVVLSAMVVVRNRRPPPPGQQADRQADRSDPDAGEHPG